MNITLGIQLASILIFDTVYALYYDNDKMPKLVLVHRHYLDPKWNNEYEYVNEKNFEQAKTDGISGQEYARHWLQSLRAIHQSAASSVLDIIHSRNEYIEDLIAGR